ncbi:MAG TPA: hypothetical protein ENF45_06070 [Bacteroidetes bacterium]|nr:hypothetical protein [Bacteroidota bacterium]
MSSYNLRSVKIVRNAKIASEAFVFADFLQDDQEKPESSMSPLDLTKMPSGEQTPDLSNYIPIEEVKKRERVAFQNGFQQGKKQGLEEAKKEVDSYIRMLKKLVQEWQEHREKFFKDHEITVVRLALDIPKRVIHREVHTGSDFIFYMVREALKRVTASSKIRIKLHPDDLKILEQGKEKLSKELRNFVQVEFLPQENLLRGGCIIESDMGIVDARLDVQLAAIEEALWEERHGD